MTISNGYLTRDEFTSVLNIKDATQFDRVDRVIEAASRQVDSMTGRIFYLTDEQTRYYDVDDVGFVFLDDLNAITTLDTDTGNYVYGTSWDVTDYDLLPYNAASFGQPY